MEVIIERTFVEKCVIIALAASCRGLGCAGQRAQTFRVVLFSSAQTRCFNGINFRVDYI